MKKLILEYSFFAVSSILICLALLWLSDRFGGDPPVLPVPLGEYYMYPTPQQDSSLYTPTPLAFTEVFDESGR